MENLVTISEQAKMERMFGEQIKTADKEYTDDYAKLENMVTVTDQEMLERMFRTQQQSDSSDEDEGMGDNSKLENKAALAKQESLGHKFRTEQQNESCEEDCDAAEDVMQHDFCGKFKEISIEGKDTVNRPPEGHLPYKCPGLTKELIDYAAKHLNETEETKKKGLKELTEFIKNELKVDFYVEDVYLLCFLRARKYDLKRTFQFVKRGVKFVESHPYLFNKNNLDLVRKVVDSKVVGFLPYRDSKGRTIILVRAELWNPDEMKAEDLLYGTIASLSIGMDNEASQVAGVVVIFDFKNLTMKHFKAFARWVVVGLQAIQNCCPFMVKELHVVHLPAVFEAIWKVVRKFLSEKMRNRISFYKSTHSESFRRKLPPCILPEELGGHLGPYSPEHWAVDLEKNEKIYNYRVTRFLSRNRK